MPGTLCFPSFFFPPSMPPSSTPFLRPHPHGPAFSSYFIVPESTGTSLTIYRVRLVAAAADSTGSGAKRAGGAGGQATCSRARGWRHCATLGGGGGGALGRLRRGRRSAGPGSGALRDGPAARRRRREIYWDCDQNASRYDGALWQPEWCPCEEEGEGSCCFPYQVAMWLC
jgi:hypothetical protein